MEDALRTRLKADPAVAAIVGAGVYWDERPQATAYPAVVLETIFGQRDQHLKGFDGFHSTRVQVNCFSTTKKEAVSLREAVIAAIVPAAAEGGTEFLRAQDIEVRQGPKSTSTGTTHNEIVEATIWHD
ncbi:DUF3168 domain-containing protein [Sphingomicrobium sp. XHP0239]|uniref:DUF3168 domain-containing protein n=1 Tax=Sphingomicrobium maritimum TaxID=3133972 RepID=UPI0031CC6702